MENVAEQHIGHIKEFIKFRNEIKYGRWSESNSFVYMFMLKDVDMIEDYCKENNLMEFFKICCKEKNFKKLKIVNRENKMIIYEKLIRILLFLIAQCAGVFLKTKYTDEQHSRACDVIMDEIAFVSNKYNNCSTSRDFPSSNFIKILKSFKRFVPTLFHGYKPDKTKFMKFKDYFLDTLFLIDLDITSCLEDNKLFNKLFGLNDPYVNHIKEYVTMQELLLEDNIKYKTQQKVELYSKQDKKNKEYIKKRLYCKLNNYLKADKGDIKLGIGVFYKNKYFLRMDCFFFYVIYDKIIGFGSLESEIEFSKLIKSYFLWDK